MRTLLIAHLHWNEQLYSVAVTACPCFNDLSPWPVSKLAWLRNNLVMERLRTTQPIVISSREMPPVMGGGAWLRAWNLCILLPSCTCQQATAIGSFCLELRVVTFQAIFKTLSLDDIQVCWIYVGSPVGWTCLCDIYFRFWLFFVGQGNIYISKK